MIEGWAEKSRRYRQDELIYTVRGQEIRQPLVTTSLSGTRLPRVAVPRFVDHGEIVRWSMLENVPG